MTWTASTLLDTFDRGHAQSAAARTFLLLGPDNGAIADQVWSESVSCVNAALLQLCQSAVDMKSLDAMANCPACNAELGIALSVADLRQWLSSTAKPQKLHQIECGPYMLSARHATLADLHAASSAPDAASARQVLFERCIVLAEHAGTPLEVGQLPESVLQAVSHLLGEQDPGANIQIGLSCHDCGCQFERGLDPTLHIWAAIESSARRLQEQVAALARGFGWTESQVLALSPRRRAAYLNLLPETH